MRRARRCGASVLVLIALTSCASTVQQQGASLTAGPQGDGLGLAGPPSASAGPTAGVVPTRGAVPSTTSGPRTGAGPVITGLPQNGDSAPDQPGPGRRGPGVTGTTVRIGFQYVDVGAGTGGVLGQDISLGDPVAQARAVANYINKHGGMGGRRLDLAPYGVPYAGYVNNAQAEYNRVCSHYTEDAKVAVVAVYVPDETLIDCLAKRDVITVANGYALDRQVHNRYARYYYAPGSMSQDRGAEVGIAGLASNGYFKGATIGLLRYDSPVYERAARSLDKALGAIGQKVKTTFEISSANTSSATSDVNAAVLRLRADGVTHVLILDNSGGIASTFMTSAQTQGYHPRYGLTTNNSPSALRQLAPSKQLDGALAVSWWWGDVGPELDQATPPALPRGRDTCLQIMRESGVDLSGKAALGSAMLTCDQLLFLDTLFDQAAFPASEALEAAADALGSRYSSTLAYRTKLAPGRHDGATLTRIIRWDGGCGCWKYARRGPDA